MYKDKEKQKEANKKAKAKFKAKQGIPIEQGIPGIPGVKPLGIPLSSTGSSCDKFETLPSGARRSIDGLTEWCRLSRIEDDREARIDRAIHYQRYVRAG